MQTTTLGTTGPEIGVIGLGCMGMTHSYDMETPRDEATSVAVIRLALDLPADIELSEADLADLDALPAPEGARY